MHQEARRKSHPVSLAPFASESGQPGNNDVLAQLLSEADAVKRRAPDASSGRPWSRRPRGSIPEFRLWHSRRGGMDVRKAAAKLFGRNLKY